jgi:glucose-1-phosphate cytidylyltransferase
MKTVILCGGLGTRLGEETRLIPKPMVSVGPYPILWHLLKSYSRFGFDDFVLALGYRAADIKNYFLNYALAQSDLAIDLGVGSVEPLNQPSEAWRLKLIDTGLNTLTAGRLLKLKDHLKSEPTFMLTYGDGLSNVDLNALLAFHRSHGKIATMTVVRPPGQFGNVDFTGNQVREFVEKPVADNRWINGGFFVFEAKIFDFLGDGKSMLEKFPLESLVRARELMAFRHEGFWQCMDTQKDKALLNEIYDKGRPPWLEPVPSINAEPLLRASHV